MTMLVEKFPSGFCIQKNLIILFTVASFYFYWASVSNAPNVLQPFWLIVLPLDVPDLTAGLLL